MISVLLIGLVIEVVVYTENPISNWVTLERVKKEQLEIMRHLNSSETRAKMRELFDRDYNYAELVTWVHEQLEFSDEKPKPILKDPFEILTLGKGRCGEFSILYVSACLAHGYNARLVLILRGSDHEWAEVEIDGEWIHVDPTDPPIVHINEPGMYAERDKKMHLIVAFESNRYEIVTSKYIH